MGNYEERKIEKAKTCYSCQHCLGLDIDFEECYKSGYCMLDVPQEDIEHVIQTDVEGVKWDERFHEIMKLKHERNIILEDSPRYTNPDDVCQFYEKRDDE